MYGGDGCIFLDEDWVLELPPVPGFCAMLCRCGPRVLCDDDGLVVHGGGCARAPGYFSFKLRVLSRVRSNWSSARSPSQSGREIRRVHVT